MEGEGEELVPLDRLLPRFMVASGALSSGICEDLPCELRHDVDYLPDQVRRRMKEADKEEDKVDKREA